ncbi:MAG TPA: hypothetical protein VFH25_06865 [Nitrososphaeraceae archaeon]|nr:hypothetical protein [Nitrososphaeraceae archaeon]
MISVDSLYKNNKMHNNDSRLIQSVRYNNYTSHRHFALCESCFWSATIFKSDKKQEHKTNACPVCFNDSSVSLIPLTKDEVFELSTRSKGGLEMKFSKLIKV